MVRRKKRRERKLTPIFLFFFFATHAPSNALIHTPSLHSALRTSSRSLLLPPNSELTRSSFPPSFFMSSRQLLTIHAPCSQTHARRHHEILTCGHRIVFLYQRTLSIQSLSTSEKCFFVRLFPSRGTKHEWALGSGKVSEQLALAKVSPLTLNLPASLDSVHVCNRTHS